MKRADIDTFEKLTAQLGSLHQEISALAKKSPNDAINTFKLQFLNRTLAKCNEFLGKHYRPFSEFDVFSSVDMPSNSDITFILSQYIECAEKLRTDNIYLSGTASWYWDIEGVEPDDEEEGNQDISAEEARTQVSTDNAKTPNDR